LSVEWTNLRVKEKNILINSMFEKIVIIMNKNCFEKLTITQLNLAGT